MSNCNLLHLIWFLFDWRFLNLHLKILGTGELKTKIDITAHFVSKQAQEKIQKVGCKLTIVKK